MYGWFSISTSLPILVLPLFIVLYFIQPWLGGSVGWSIVPYTKRLSVLIPVRGMYGRQLINASLSHWRLSLSQTHPLVRFKIFFHFFHTDRCTVTSHRSFNCISVMAKDVEHLYMCLGATCMSSAMEVLCLFLKPNWIVWYVFANI